MSKKRSRQMLRLITAIYFCTILCGCTTGALLLNTGERTEWIRGITGAALGESILLVDCDGISIEKGLPVLEIDCEVPQSRETKKYFQKSIAFDLSDAVPNSSKQRVDPLPYVDDQANLTDMKRIQIIDLTYRQMNLIYAGTNALSLMPAETDSCLFQQRSSDHIFSRAVFIERTDSGCNTYYLSTQLPTLSKSGSRFWKIPVFLPVAITWDAFNTVAVPVLFIQQFFFTDWLPH